MRAGFGKIPKLTYPPQRHIPLADPEIFEKGRKTVYQSPSSFIANVHNELHTFYTEKTAF